MSKTQKVISALTGWRDMTRALEALLVDNLAATSPWLAPVIPAYIGWRNMTTRLDFPNWVALVGALVIETLGLATVHTVFTLWDYNDGKRKIDQRAPVWVAVLIAAMYIVVVLTVNVLLDQGIRPPIEQVAQALLSLLSVVGSVTLAIRANHARRLAEIATEKEERRAMRTDARIPNASPSLPADAAHDPGADAAHLCALCGANHASQQALAAHMRWTHPKLSGDGSAETRLAGGNGNRNGHHPTIAA